MLCCNDDNGNFNNQIVKVDIHDSIELETIFVDEKSFELAGLDCVLGSHEDAGSIIIGARKFPYHNHITWVGNIYWDLFWMYGKDALDLLNCLKESKHFSVEQAESRLYSWWYGDQPFGQRELGLIAKFSSAFCY
jgi:hypothetical protein